MGGFGSGTSRGTLSNPQDIFASEEDQLMIADSGNHRVLVYDSIPGSDGASANRVLGQPNFTVSQANRGEEPNSNTLNNPFGVYTNGGLRWVADTSNNRVLRFSVD